MMTTNPSPTIFDPLAAGPESAERVSPDRVYYAPGVLLDAVDFRSEQLYHRGRLARTLAYLHGYGTVAGLRVDWRPPIAPGGTDPETNTVFAAGREAELVVNPGLAIDRLGRLIEVPRVACLRSQRWFTQQQTNPTQLVQALHPQDGLTETRVNRSDSLTALTVSAASRAVVVDIFLRFVVCERGKTPAFAAGPLDATDAIVPARLRDGYEICLVLRQEATASLANKLPQSPWANANTVNDLQTVLFEAWAEDTEDWDAQGKPLPLLEHATGEDTTAVFLARLLFPATLDGAGTVQPVPDAPVVVDNFSRRFIYPTEALAQWTTFA
jgi:hypothetical protein